MKKPTIKPYKRHAMLCTGSKCEPEGDRSLLKHLKHRVARVGLDEGKNAVRVNRAGCLGVCEKGPIMVVHPEGVWYCHLDKEAIDRIVDEHFGQGKIVEELAFHVAD